MDLCLPVTMIKLAVRLSPADLWRNTALDDDGGKKNKKNSIIIKFNIVSRSTYNQVHYCEMKQQIKASEINT